MDDVARGAKWGFRDGAEPFKPIDFAIESAVKDVTMLAFCRPTARGLYLVSSERGDWTSARSHVGNSPQGAT